MQRQLAEELDRQGLRASLCDRAMTEWAQRRVGAHLPTTVDAYFIFCHRYDYCWAGTGGLGNSGLMAAVGLEAWEPSVI